MNSPWPPTPGSFTSLTSFASSTADLNDNAITTTQEPISPALSSTPHWQTLGEAAVDHLEFHANPHTLKPSASAFDQQQASSLPIDKNANWASGSPDRLSNSANDEIHEDHSEPDDNMDAEGGDDSSSNPRRHGWYAREKAGENYDCPVTECDWEGCKLKCDYHKHIDKHLLPYECSRKACKKSGGSQRFSSRACLLRHEREKHRLHGAAQFYCRYVGQGKCERTEGYGRPFPRSYNAEDHMKRCHPPEELAPPPTPKRQRRRRISNVSRASSSSGGRSSSSTTPTITTSGTSVGQRARTDSAASSTAFFGEDMFINQGGHDQIPLRDIECVAPIPATRSTIIPGRRPLGTVRTKSDISPLAPCPSGVAKVRRPTSANRIHEIEAIEHIIESGFAKIRQLQAEGIQDIGPVGISPPVTYPFFPPGEAEGYTFPPEIFGP